jgi:dTDP-4-dehydrorhamnose reductase
MKLLIIGGSGLIGSHLVRAANCAGHQVTATYRQFPTPGLVHLDCGNPKQVEAVLDQAQPDAIIHAAGWSWVDGCEADAPRAMRENCDQPAQLAARCNQLGIRFAAFSSSYVFDGEQGLYVESANPNPINVYGESKLAGERRILEACPTAIVARVICVYGAEAQKKNFACQVHKAMVTGIELVLPSDQEGNPTYAGDLARWLLLLLSRREKGIWHLAGPWPECTRPEWAEKLVAVFHTLGVQPRPGFSVRTVPTAQLGQPAKRPLKAGLISLKAVGLDFEPTEFSQTVREVVAFGS